MSTVVRPSSAWVAAKLSPNVAQLFCVRGSPALKMNIAYGGSDLPQTPPGSVSINSGVPSWSIPPGFTGLKPDPTGLSAATVYSNQNYGGGAPLNDWWL